MEKRTKEKERKGIVMMAGILLISLSLTTGCSHQSKTVKTETVAPGNNVTTVQETKTTESSTAHHGILGGAFDVVGEVLAFPFEVIAGVFRFIF